MDPVTVGAVLLAIVSGASGPLGEHLWEGVSRLVRRPFRHPDPASDVELVSGEAELAALRRAPADQGQAVALARVLLARAGAEEEFRMVLEDWWERATPLRAAQGNVTNVISGGTARAGVAG